MEIAIVVSVIIACVLLYFFIGMVLNFVIGFWPIILCAPVCVVIGFFGGWTGAIAALLLIMVVVGLTNSKWHSSDTYFAWSDWVEKKFNLKD